MADLITGPPGKSGVYFGMGHLRTVLSRYVAVDPTEWMFSTNAYGRPEIVNPPARDACLSFNISHTHSLIVLGVTRRRALGVDVENVCTREISIDIADRYFAPSRPCANPGGQVASTAVNGSRIL